MTEAAAPPDSARGEIERLRREAAGLREELDAAKRELERLKTRHAAILDALFEDTEHLVGLLDPSGTVREVNAAARRSAAHLVEGIVGRPFWTAEWWAHSPAAQAHLRDAVERAARGEDVRMESTYRNVDGTIRPIDVALRPVKGDRGDVIALIAEGRDIAALRALEARLEATQGQAHVGTWEYDPVTRKTSWSNPLYRPEEIDPVREAPSADDLLEFVHPDDRAALRGSLLSACDQDETRALEVRTNPARGPVRWFELTMRTVRDASGRTFYVSGTQQDITERKRVEEALRESERRVREIFQLVPASISFSRKADDVFIEVNRFFEEETGLRREEVIGRSARDLDIWDDVAERDRLFRLLHEGRDIHNHEVWVSAKDGRKRLKLFSACGVSIGGEPGWLCLLTDITAQRLAEETVREGERRLQLLVENSTDILAVIDTAGVYLSIRGPSKRILGYEPEELIGRNGFEFIHPDDVPGARKALEELLGTPGIVRHAEYRSRHKQGDWLEMEASGTSRLDEPGIGGIVLCVREITERKEAERERARLQEQLQQAMKMEAVGRLAGGVAHDFNNLLTAISGNLEMAMLDLDPSDPLQQYLIDASRAASSAADLTRQLLTFSRRQIIEPRVVDLNELIGRLRKMLTRLIGDDVHLEAALDGGVGSVRVDPGQFEQVVVNLCVNARDAMPDGGRLVIETADIDLDEAFCAIHGDVQPGKYVRMTVSDTGEGMSEEVRRRIFEPFFTTKGEGRGTGLGLSMVFGMVKQAGGLIDVHSEIGMGAAFRIYLPCVEEPAEQLAPVSAAVELPRGEEVVLVVEDNASVRDLATAMLKRLGYRVLSAANGGEAFLIAERRTDPIHLLLTDVVMPSMNGRELAERLRKSHPEMKVLFTSGYTDDTVVRHGIMREVVHYLAKPYSIQALAAKIRRVLD